MAKTTATHIAFSDESSYLTGRYRGIGMISLCSANETALSSTLEKMLEECGVSELKWTKLCSAKHRFAMLKIIDHIVPLGARGIFRVDVLTWDVEDSRHKIRDRDDIENLHRMYFQLLKNVLRDRWPDGSEWHLFPDEQTAMQWDRLEEFLNTKAAHRVIAEQNLFTNGEKRISIEREFNVSAITECKSEDSVLVQLADFFVGIGVYSRASYERFQQWQQLSSQQHSLFDFFEENTKLSSADRERCQVLQVFDRLCKKSKLGVSLKSARGLRTFAPQNPFNFWWYVPQHELDKAPTR